jgi:hypothetical protein
MQDQTSLEFIPEEDVLAPARINTFKDEVWKFVARIQPLNALPGVRGNLFREAPIVFGNKSLSHAVWRIEQFETDAERRPRQTPSLRNIDGGRND